MQIDEDTAFNIRTKIETIIREAKAALDAARTALREAF